MGLLLVLVLVLLLFVVVVRLRRQKVYVVSFAHNCCSKAQQNLEKTAKKFGADYVYSLNLETLEAPEKVKNYIRTNKRGAGYWIWKPYAMNQILKISNPGDIIIYTDSSTYFVKSLKNICTFINKNSIFAFRGVYIQSEWTKMNAVGSVENWCKTEGSKPQIVATIVGVLNNDSGNFLVDTWREAMSVDNSQVFDDSPSTITNCPDFKESRHDQQMLSLLLYKYFNTVELPHLDNKDYYGFVLHENINGLDRHD